MPRALWSGSLSFGLVNVPVKVVSAVSEKDVRFHWLHADDGVRIQMKRVCPADGEEVPFKEILKGYEVGKDQYVTFTEKELEAIEADSSRTVDLLDFVKLKEIDPAYFDHPYFLLPEKSATKAYGLLRAALQKSGRVGIAQVVMRGKEHLVAIRPQGELLMMETMRFAEEVVPPTELEKEIPTAHAPSAKEVAMAEKLIETLADTFDPTKYKDTYRERVLESVEKKMAGEHIVTPPHIKRASPETDLLAALERSLAEHKRKPGMEA